MTRERKQLLESFLAFVIRSFSKKKEKSLEISSRSP